jgi:F-type H+-transporting ATPase subunit b
MEQILNILGSVGFNWHVALANFINFLIILFLLNKFFFGKLGKVISNRQEVIERGVAEALEAEKALATAGEKKKEIIHDAKKEGHVIISEAETQAEALAAEIKKEAEKEAAVRLNALLEKEATLKAKVEKDFAEKAPALVAKMYEETLRSNMTVEDNNALVAHMK